MYMIIKYYQYQTQKGAKSRLLELLNRCNGMFRMMQIRVNVSPLQDVTRDKRLSAPKHKDLFCSVLFEKHVCFGRAVGGGAGEIFWGPFPVT